jgi:hypothetical protein
MKVLNIISSTGFSSTEELALKVCKSLKEEGHETALMGLPSSSVVKNAESEGIQTFTAELNSRNPLTIIQTILKFKKVDKAFKPDVVITHDGELFFYFTHVRYWESPKWKLVRVRGDRRPPKTGPLTLWLYKNSVDKVVTYNEDMSAIFVQAFKLPESKVAFYEGKSDKDLNKVFVNI